MSIKKQFLRTKDVCKVTFELSEALSATATSATVVGEFNDWNKTATPMRKRKKDGVFYLSLDLAKDREFQFRYLLDENTWVNDEEADSYAPNPFGEAENCVLSTHNPDEA